MKLYAERDIQELDRRGKFSVGNYYSRHVSAMTSEGLHSKSDIAAELAYRDAEIDRLLASLDKLCTELENDESHGGGAYDTDCSICAAIEEARGLTPNALREPHAGTKPLNTEN